MDRILRDLERREALGENVDDAKDAYLVRVGKRDTQMERAWAWTNYRYLTKVAYWWEDTYYAPSQRIAPVYGPWPRCKAELVSLIASHFNVSYRGESWGDANGTLKIDGLTLTLLPKNPKHRSSHRLKLHCPECGKLFGPAKWRQHAKYKHPND